jgi:uncharacterized alpha-E superfamily protein
MLSRVAASFYWLSRYIERSDGMLRMLKINYNSSQDAVQEFTWEPVIRIFAGSDGEETEDLVHNSRAVIKFILLRFRAKMPVAYRNTSQKTFGNALMNITIL